ncbi:MAG: TVP38/TMEM64 family protein [Firmicutes bacterium]|nr:TVP38/TMEM64 family protein [Bacillota bacterium]
MDNDKKQMRRQRFRKISAVVKLILLLVIVIGIPAYIFFFQHQLLEDFSSIDDVYAFFIQYKSQSILIYLGLQVLQIVICIIPGQALQLAAGYLFHFWLGLLLSVIGAGLGTIATYYLAKVLGHDAMHMIFGEERIRTYLKKLNSKRGVIIVFLIYLIPGIPKDLCTYAAGLSEMKLKPFLLLSMTGRLPGMMGSLLIGHQIQMGGYKAAAIIGGVAVVLFVLGLIFHKPLMELSDTGYEKLKKML